MKRAVLLDVSAIMYRAFYANLNMKTKNEPTGAIYGFINTVLSIINQLNPDYIGACFDVKRSTLRRTQIYSQYKAQRDNIPEDLLQQIPRIEEFLDYYGIKKIKVDGYEADDVLGNLAQQFKNKGVEVYVITGDKDLSQILEDNIKIALLGKGESGGLKILESESDVVEQLGVIPKLIPDLFGLIGDSSDGIPGVRKIGAKKAIALLERFKNLEGIYENIEHLTEISGIGNSLVNNIIEDKEIAFLSKKLATVEKIEFDIDLNEFKIRIDKTKLHKLFKELEFKSLIKKFGLSEEIIEKKDGQQLGLFLSESKLETSSNSSPNFRIIFGKELINCLEGIELLSIYCEDNKRIAISAGNLDLYVKIENEEDKEIVLQILNSEKNFLSYNFKTLFKKGYKVKNMEMDLLLGYHLLTAQTKEQIEVALSNLLDKQMDKYSEVFGKRKIDELSEEEYAKFLTERSRGIYEAYKILKKQLISENLYEILNEIEMPLIEVLYEMEKEGIEISVEHFKAYGIELTIRIEELLKKIYSEAECEFNINSPKQLGEVLFINLNIPPLKKTKTGFSTDSEVLERLKEQGYKIADYILEYRKLTKLNTTYIEPLCKMIDSKGRVHTTFNQTGTVTGRLSSSEPNLQNIPARTDEGMKIREGFIAKKGYLLLGIDYSQIELRVLAEISQDERLIEAYNKNLDLHSLTARNIFMLSMDEEVSREQRDIAKIVNFSVIYGKTAFGLAQELKISPKEASEYIERYFEQYPKVKELENKIIQFAEKKGYVETYFKRKRVIEGINSKNRVIKTQAQRMAVNTVIQGTAAEILKKVMIELYKYLKGKEDIKMLLQVHDELIFEVKEEKALEYKNMIENLMRECVKFSKIKLEVNGAIGRNWAETK